MLVDIGRLRLIRDIYGGVAIGDVIVMMGKNGFVEVGGGGN